MLLHEKLREINDSGDVGSCISGLWQEAKELQDRLCAAAETTGNYEANRIAMENKINELENSLRLLNHSAVTYNQLSEENDQLRAKLAECEGQEPVGFIDSEGEPHLSVEGLKGGMLYREPPQAAIPDDWKIVPKGFGMLHFKEYLGRGLLNMDRSHYRQMKETYEKLISAAPSPVETIIIDASNATVDKIFVNGEEVSQEKDNE